MVAADKDRLAGTLAPPGEVSFLATWRLGVLAVDSAFPRLAMPEVRAGRCGVNVAEAGGAKEG